jgi:hypothetical protein
MWCYTLPYPQEIKQYVTYPPIQAAHPAQLYLLPFKKQLLQTVLQINVSHSGNFFHLIKIQSPTQPR